MIVVVGSFACNTNVYLGNSDNSETNQNSRKIYTCIIEGLFHNTHIYLGNLAKLPPARRKIDRADDRFLDEFFDPLVGLQH